jgi:hypothetical protein
MGKKNSKYKKDGWQIFLVIGHTLWLLVLTILLQYSSLVRVDEVPYFKAEFIIKKLLFSDDKKPVGDSVVFLDDSKDIVLHSRPDYRGADTVIRDRSKLTRLFTILNRTPSLYRFILCDIVLSDTSNSKVDSALKIQIEKLPRFITASELRGTQLLKPIFKVNSACVNYSPVEQSTFVKMPLFYNDSLKSLPVALCELSSPLKFTRKHDITFVNGRPSFNYIIPDFYYRPQNIKEIQSRPLGSLLLYPDSTISNFLKNKWIVIGDLSNDRHDTYASSLPGCFILFNTYLTLMNTKAAVITWPWVLILLIVYGIISYRIICRKRAEISTPERIKHVPFLRSIFIKYFSFLGICILLNLFSYLFFGIFISMFYMATYLTAFEYIMLRKRDIRQQLTGIKKLI